MTTRPPTWMIILLGAQLALALAGFLAVMGLAAGMSQHSPPFAHDDVPLLFPVISVVVLGVLALLLGRRSHRTLSKVLALAPFPVAIALMIWSWW